MPACSRGWCMTVDREEIKKLFKQNGLKATRQRFLVLEAVASMPEKHLTAEEIFELVKVDYPEIGLATVYRNIQMLCELHLIDRINFDDGYARYEIGTTQDCEQKHHHHHLICRKCGKVISFRDDLLEELEEKITATTGFKIVNHEVKLYGYCRECGGNLIEEKRE